jgi:hypothetical protein
MPDLKVKKLDKMKKEVTWTFSKDEVTALIKAMAEKKMLDRPPCEIDYGDEDVVFNIVTDDLAFATVHMLTDESDFRDEDDDEEDDAWSAEYKSDDDIEA